MKAIEAEKSEKKKVEIKFEPSKSGSLYSILLSWRAAQAEADDVPASNIAPIRTLKAIAETKPVTLAGLRKVEGMGTKRIRNYGAEILDIVLRHLGQDPAKAGIGDMAKVPTKKANGATYYQTKEMAEQGMSVEAIAKARGLAESTIFGHLTYWVEQGSFPASRFVSSEKMAEIRDYFESTGDPKVATARDVLGEDYQYAEIRMVLAEMKREGYFKES